jgi:hypothetical protein
LFTFQWIFLLQFLAYRCTSLHRVLDFTLTLKENKMVGFYRSAFLASVSPSTKPFLERLTRTETFKEFVTSGWDLREE